LVQSVLAGELGKDGGGESAMSIDVLAYELKYKNDPMVLDLLKAYQVMKTDFEEYVEGCEGGGE
jgi:hypothetical protein